MYEKQGCIMRVNIKAPSASRFAELQRMFSDEADIIIGNENSDGNGPPADYDADVLIWEPGMEEGFDFDSLDENMGAGHLVLIMDGPTGELNGDGMQAGVKAILPTDISADAIVAAVRAVAAGLVVLSGDGSRAFARTLPVRRTSSVDSLTPRETEVLSAMADGITNREIALRLHVSEHTVKFHVATILSKLGATSRTEAVTLAIRHGLLMI